MSKNGGVIGAHGGRLVNRMVSRDDGSDGSAYNDMFSLQISADLANDVENIADGIFSPLEGFLGQGDVESVAKRGRLADDTAWTIPIVLDATEETASAVKDAGDVMLRDPQGTGIAILHAEEVYRPAKEALAQGVYGTTDRSHPGVAHTMSLHDDFVSGAIDYVQRPADTPLRSDRMTPVQTRKAFEEAGWKTICAFQTRNPPHVAHEMLQKTSITTRDGVFVNPLVGRKKKGDFVDDVIIKCYKEMIRLYYPESRCHFATLHTEMRYAGPREAIHHAIMRQNYGCTHIIIGRDHAGVGSFYDPFAAQEIFSEYPELEIQPVFFPAFFYCGECLTYTNGKCCPHDAGAREQISGTQLREMIQENRPPSKFVLRPEVSDIILKHPSPFVEE